MAHIVDWFIVFTLIFIATIALERASAWLFEGIHKRSIELSEVKVEKQFSKDRD